MEQPSSRSFSSTIKEKGFGLMLNIPKANGNQTRSGSACLPSIQVSCHSGVEVHSARLAEQHNQGENEAWLECCGMGQQPHEGYRLMPNGMPAGCIFVPVLPSASAAYSAIGRNEGRSPTPVSAFRPFDNVVFSSPLPAPSSALLLNPMSLPNLQS